MMKKVLKVSALALAAFHCGPPTTNTDVCKGRKAGDIIVTEVMIDPASGDTGNEWFELHNTLGTPIDLKGLTLTYKDGSGSGAKTHVIRAGTIPANGYFAVGDVRMGALPAWIGYAYADGLGDLANGAGSVGIKCGSLTLDEFSWTRAARPNRSRQLPPGAPMTSMGNDDENNWCDTPAGTVYVTPNAGTPGAPNVMCEPEAMTGTCVENGAARAIRAAGAGDLLITEIMASPKTASSETVGEWFEMLATKAVDLNDITMATATSSSTDKLESPNCLAVNPGDYVLITRSNDAFVNGALPMGRALQFPSIGPGNNRIYLRRGDAGIDEAAFFASQSGVSWQLDLNRVGVPPIDPATNDAPEAFCKSMERWNPDGGPLTAFDVIPDAGDLGSPGRPNKVCPFVDSGVPDSGPPLMPGECYDPVTTLPRQIVKPALGDLVITEFMADPGNPSTTNEWFEVLVKTDVDLNGVQMKNSTAATTNTLSGNGCLRVDAGSLLLFAKEANYDTNGNIGPVYSTVTINLNNSNGGLVLFNDAGMLDTVTWAPTQADGKSTQLDVTKLDHLLNDMASNFCVSDAGFPLLDGGTSKDLGTPGLPNKTCQ